MAWRDKVYNVSVCHTFNNINIIHYLKGTLRPKTTETITGSYLSDLLDGLTMTVRSNYATTISDAHDVNKIVDGLYLGDK